MKKFLSIILSLLIVFTLSVTSLATNISTSSYSVTMNEYDLYVATRRATHDELEESNISSRSIDLIKSNAIENKLKQLSTLSTKDLHSMGYTNQQIDLLHNYNGERIETTSKFKGLFADMTATFSNIHTNQNFATVQVDWEWSNPPLLDGPFIVDIIAMRWYGINDSNTPINVAFNSSGSFSSVKYYNTMSGLYKYTIEQPIICNSPYEHAYSKFPISLAEVTKYGMLENHYAKSGSFRVMVDRIGTDFINEVDFVFAYGHNTVVISPTLSLPTSLGIGFSWGTETMVEKAIKINRFGFITEY